MFFSLCFSPAEIRKIRIYELQECHKLQTAIAEGWLNESGRSALNTLITKAEHVCSITGFDVKDSYKSVEFMDHAGGSSEGPKSSGCLVHYAQIDKKHHEELEKKRDPEILRNPEAWHNATGWMHQRYTPDVVYRKKTLADESFFTTGQVKSAKIMKVDFLQLWNQALIGLNHRNVSVAVYIEPKEAGIVTIKLEDGNIKTYRRIYQIGETDPKKIRAGDTVGKPEQLCHFFRDLVITFCRHGFSV